jgi:RNA polymerase sigma-70 factor (ECF subfamily)
MRRLARALLHDDALAEDVVQDASLAVLERVRHDEKREVVRAELRDSYWFAVVRNLASKLARGRRRREERERLAARPEAQPGTDEIAQRLALHKALVAAVEKLPAPYRDVVVRRFIDGHKPQQIAAELKVPLATVKTRLRRALAQLREKLRRDWGGEFASALVVLARPPVAPIVLAGSATGALVMGTKVKGVAALAVAAIAVIWSVQAGWIGRPDSESASSAPAPLPASATTSATTPVAAPVEVARIEQPPEPVAAVPPPVDPRRLADIHGRVVGSTGQPIAAARIELVERVGSELAFHVEFADVLPEKRVATVSSSDGSFEFAAVRRGVAFKVVANAEPDLVGETLSAIQAGDQDVVVTLLPLAMLAGIVRRAGGPGIEGATVAVSCAGWGEPEFKILARATTDVEGRFTVSGLPVRDVWVRAFTSDGHYEKPHTVTLKGGERTEVELVLGSNFGVEGHLVDAASGEPIAGARIFDSDFGGGTPLTETDEDGVFRVQSSNRWVSSPMSTMMFVQADGYGFRGMSAPAPADPPSKFEVKLVRGRAIRGRLVNVQRAPVDGALVAIHDGEDFTVSRQVSMKNECVATRSAADGSFALLDVDPRPYHVLQVRHETIAMSDVPIVGDATSSDDLDLGDVVVHEGAFVTGHVFDEKQQPLPPCEVWLEPYADAESARKEVQARMQSEFRAYMSRRSTAMLADGSFSFGCIPEGRWVASVHERSFEERGRSVPFTVHADDVLENIEITYSVGRVIAGRVVDAAGAPVPSVEVQAQPRVLSNGGDPLLLADLGVAVGLAFARSDSQGNFRLTHLGSESYRVVARGTSIGGDRSRLLAGATIDDVTAGHTDLKITLCDGVVLAGQVTDADGAAAVNAFIVAFDAERHHVAGTRSDDAGHFELVVPKAGPFRLEVRAMPRGVFLSGSAVTGPPHKIVEDVRPDGTELVIQLPARDR